MFDRDSEAKELYDQGRISHEQYEQMLRGSLQPKKYRIDSKVLTEYELERAIKELDHALDLISKNNALPYTTSQPMCKELCMQINKLERILRNGQD